MPSFDMPPCHSRGNEILLMFAQWEGFSATRQEGTGGSRAGRRSFAGGGCEGGAPLLKFLVCWDAAVCAVSAGGFLYV
jgi:hypothetical protein